MGEGRRRKDKEGTSKKKKGKRTKEEGGSCEMQEGSVLELTRCECLLCIRIFLVHVALEEAAGIGKKKEETGRRGKERKRGLQPCQTHAPIGC